MKDDLNRNENLLLLKRDDRVYWTFFMSGQNISLLIKPGWQSSLTYLTAYLTDPLLSEHCCIQVNSFMQMHQVHGCDYGYIDPALTDGRAQGGRSVPVILCTLFLSHCFASLWNVSPGRQRVSTSNCHQHATVLQMKTDTEELFSQKVYLSI